MQETPLFDEISIAVLRGQSPGVAAADYGVPVRRIKAILNNYCRRANPSALRAMHSGRVLSEISIAVLRKHRDRFLPARPACAQLTKASSIWCLPGIPGITLAGMYEAGIDTIDDLLKRSAKELSKLPKIGAVGLGKTWAALRSHGFEFVA